MKSLFIFQYQFKIIMYSTPIYFTNFKLSCNPNNDKYHNEYIGIYQYLYYTESIIDQYQSKIQLSQATSQEPAIDYFETHYLQN